LPLSGNEVEKILKAELPIDQAIRITDTRMQSALTEAVDKKAAKRGVKK
jgi:hypothetical protein